MFDRGAFAAACHEIRRVVPIDQLGIARVSDDGSHFRVYVGWTAPDLGVPAVEWGQRVDSAREQLDRWYAGEPRVCRDTRTAPGVIEPAFAEAGVLCTLSVPIGTPLQGVVGFGFRSADMLRDEHLPILRTIAKTLIDGLDWSLLSAHAARLRTITEAMPMGAIMLASDGTIEEINPAAARLAGREPQELLGRSIRELVCAPDGGLLGWRIDESKGPAPARVRTADGTLRPVLAQMAAAARGVARYGGALRPALSRRHQRRAGGGRRAAPPRARASPARRRSAGRGLRHRRHRPLHLRLARGRAHPRLHARGDLRHDRLRRAQRRRRAADVQHARRDASTWTFASAAKTGARSSCTSPGACSPTPTGHVLGSEGFGVDVTSERDAQRRLLLADRLAALGLLVAGIGHEINNPAAYVSLGVQQIARHLRAAVRQGPDEARAALERALPILDDVAAGVHRIAEIVGELKLFARDPDVGTPGPIDLNGVVRSAATLVQAELRSRARLVLELGELPPAPGSWARLSQVALNLLINAAQAIPAGAPERHSVFVTTSIEAGEVRIVVRDSGCGIDPAERQRIFDPFYTTKPVGEGTGLGLAISYDIVRRLGGTIAVESEPGGGSCFTVSLPVRAIDADSPARAAVTPEASGSVLVVDDERPLGAAIARELAVRMQVELVHSGGEALMALRRAPLRRRLVRPAHARSVGRRGLPPHARARPRAGRALRVPHRRRRRRRRSGVPAAGRAAGAGEAVRHGRAVARRRRGGGHVSDDGERPLGEHVTRGADETRALGERLGRTLAAGDIVALVGELGAGKTCVRAGAGARPRHRAAARLQPDLHDRQGARRRTRSRSSTSTSIASSTPASSPPSASTTTSSAAASSSSSGPIASPTRCRPSASTCASRSGVESRGRRAACAVSSPR